MNKLNKFNLRLELTNNILSQRTLEDVFIKSILIFVSENKIKLNIYFWYDSIDKSKINIIESKFFSNFNNVINYSINEATRQSSVWFDIVSEANQNHCEKYKFRLIYNDENSFVNCIFQFYSFVKAALNKGVVENENRNVWKQRFSKKERNKRTNLENKK
jgi:hypothetical protein